MKCFALVALAALSQAATLLVLNKEDATLAIVDPASGKVLGIVPTGEGPHEVATDGKLAYVGNYGTGPAPGKTISVIDLTAKKELHRVDVTPLQRPHGMFVSGGKAYFTAEANRLIARYDPASNQVDWIMGTGLSGTHMVMLTRDGSKIFTSNIGSDAIGIFERSQNGAWNFTPVSVGKGPEAIEVSPDEKEIWTAQSRDGGVSIIDIATKKVTGTVDAHTKRSNRLKITPDGKTVLITDLEAGELVVLDRASRKETKRIQLGRSPEGILIVPDGSRAYIAVNGDNYLAVLDLKRLEVTGKVETGKGPDGMAWIQ